MQYQQHILTLAVRIDDKILSNCIHNFSKVFVPLLATGKIVHDHRPVQKKRKFNQ